MHVLASIRSATIDASHKNELRDLVLSYTNGGKDPSLLIQIKQQLSQHGVRPSDTPTTLESKEVPMFGSSRNTPSFSVAAPRVQPKDPVAAPPEPVPMSAPVVLTPATPEPVMDSPIPPPVAPAAPVSPTPVPRPTPAAAPTTPAQPAASDMDALARIREIKALVNDQVGNPVNLIDINNTVGREYMAALLEAMKSLNAGSNSDTAMQRLEIAYVAVEQVLAGTAKSPAVEPEVQTPITKQAVPASASTPSVQPSEPVTPIVTPATPAKQPSVASPVLKKAPTVPPKQFVPPTAPVNNHSRWTEQPLMPATPVSSIDSESDPAPVPSAPGIPNPNPVPPAPDTSSTSPVSLIKPLSADGEPLKKVADLPTADSLTTASKDGDPLYTKEVEDGLNQLLSDWSIFKKSGLFGTGGKGADHPLFAKIKDIEIPVLLAGRFDGATQEIKQSITDYMNGWRYEQGIIYEAGETFEHYLRRVIRHILDLQK